MHPRLVTYLQRSMARFFAHTYTWIDVDATPVLSSGMPTYDSEGNQIFTNASPITSKPCLFLWDDISTTDDTGIVIVRTPTLYVPFDDAINVGDTVQSIATHLGVVLITEAHVQTIDGTAETGDMTMKVVRLSGAQTQ